jgi:Cytochrome C oxidase subunit II, transmembrane domain
MGPTNVLAPVSTPAESIFGLSIFVLLTMAAIFVVVFVLLAYAVVRFRYPRGDDLREPAQIYGSTQAELAWTVIPILIVVGAVLGVDARDLRGPKCAASGYCAECYRDRSPILVGISPSRLEHSYSQ